MSDNPLGEFRQPEPRRLPIATQVRGNGRLVKKPFPLAKVLIGTSAVLFVFCAGGLGLILWATGSFGPNWKPFEPPAVGARVEMPYPAGMSAASQDRGALGVTVHEGIRLFPRQEFALVTTMNSAGPDSALDWIQAILRKEYPNATQTSRIVTSTPQGLQAVDAVFDLGNGEVMVCRAVGAGSTVYLVTALGSGFAPQTSEVQRFLNSLTITDPDRLAAAKSETGRPNKQEAEAAELETRYDRDLVKYQADLARKSAETVSLDKKQSEWAELESRKYTGRPLPDLTKAKDVRVVLSFDREVFSSTSAMTGSGVRNQALFLRDNDAVSFMRPSGMKLEPNVPLTIAGWFKAVEPVGDIIRVLNETGLSNDELFTVALDRTSVRAYFGSDILGPELRAAGDLRALVAPWTPDRNWHHFAITREPKAQGEVIAFYFDGKLAIRQYRPYATNWSAARVVMFGGHRLMGRKGKFLGAVDEVVLASRAYTSDEVRELGAFPTPPPEASKVPTASDIPGLVLSLPFDDFSQTSPIDAVARKPVGSIGGVVSEVPGVRGKAIGFEAFPSPWGSLQHVPGLDLKDQVGVLKLKADDPFTVATWCRTTEMFGHKEPWSAYTPVKDTNSTDTPPRDRLGIYFWHEGVIASLGTSRSKPPDVSVQLTAAHRHGGEWFHLAMTRSKSGTIRLAVNGEFVPQKEDARFPFDLAPTAFFLAPKGGELDEFCVFNRDLTADELKFLAGKGTAKPK